MGEARRRGTFEERKSQSIAKRKLEIEEMIKGLIAKKKWLDDHYEELNIYQKFNRSKISHLLKDLQAYYSRTYGQEAEA